MCAFMMAIGLSGSSAPRALAAAEVDHSTWDQLLKRHVSRGLVDYKGLQAERRLLDQYLDELEAVDVDTLPSKEAKLTFWINAYNALVVKGVLDHDPLKSVKDVDGFFDKTRYRVANELLTLNQIEGNGRKLGDWRIHFAVVCASSSCPPLIQEAFVPERLDQQLADRTKAFLADRERSLRVEGDVLWASKIFDWYAKDFLPAGGLFQRLSAEKLLDLLGPYLPEDVASAKGQPLTLKFLDYDWTLNEQRGLF
jgi:hypothetical protein